MSSERVLDLLEQLKDLDFNGYITFHQLSEAFLDKRLLRFARMAKLLGMQPYIHTNGDMLRNNEKMSEAAAQIFEYMVIGLYDYKTEEEREAEKVFWRNRLIDTHVLFSQVEDVYARTHSPDNKEMKQILRMTHPNAACSQPLEYLLIHYNGDVACCCEDMYGELLRFNVFETDIRQVWYSDRHIKLVSDLSKGHRTSYGLCSSCTMGASRYSNDALKAIKHLAL